MDKQEFFLLIPAIIYGVAIIDLLKIFQHKTNYWELVGWGLFLMVIIINTWIELYNKLGSFVDNNLNFFLIIAQAILFAQAAYVLTPEEKDIDTRKYFHDIRKKFFIIITAITAYNILVQFLIYQDDRLYVRLIGVVLFAICIFVDKVWVRVGILAVMSVLAFRIVFLQ